MFTDTEGLAASIFTLMMEAASITETAVNSYQATHATTQKLAIFTSLLVFHFLYVNQLLH
jgi:hypothetical protein